MLSESDQILTVFLHRERERERDARPACLLHFRSLPRPSCPLDSLPFFLSSFFIQRKGLSFWSKKNKNKGDFLIYLFFSFYFYFSFFFSFDSHFPLSYAPQADLRQNEDMWFCFILFVHHNVFNECGWIPCSRSWLSLSSFIFKFFSGQNKSTARIQD